MPNYSHDVQLNIPIQSLWEFVSEMDHWAPLVPGYIEHEKKSESQSTWSFYTDVGFMKKKIELQVDITSWDAPHKVQFELLGINERFTGYGYFSAVEQGENKILMTGFLEINAEGLMAKMANSILNNSLPEITEELAEAVAAKAVDNYLTENYT